MRWKLLAGVLLTLAFLVPAGPAVAQTGSLTLTEAACRPMVYADVRDLVTIDLDTASDDDVELLANEILSVAKANSLSTLTGALEKRLEGTTADLRAFLKTVQRPWATDLRIAIYATLTDAGARVQEAARNALDGNVDAYLTYLNNDLHVARAADAGTLKVYRDIRTMVTIDLDTAADGQVRLLATQILSAAAADSLGTLTGELEERLRGTSEDLRAFLKTVQRPWTAALRIAVYATTETAGVNVLAAAGKALADGTTDALLTYLNNDLYVARSLDCA